MASNSRESRIIDAVTCPNCAAPIGQLCRVDRSVIERDRNRPILHTEKRETWQQWKKTNGLKPNALTSRRGREGKTMATVFVKTGESLRERLGSGRAYRVSCTPTGAYWRPGWPVDAEDRPTKYVLKHETPCGSTQIEADGNTTRRETQEVG